MSPPGGGGFGGFGGGGGGGGGFGRAGMGIGGMLVMLVLSLVFGGNMFDGSGVPNETAAGDITAPSGATGPNGAPVQQTASEKEMVDLVSFVLDDAQEVWARALPQSGAGNYREAKLVLFRQAVESGCGVAPSDVGPFYCPADEKVYIDLAFFEDLRRRFGAPGDFAQAYVLAHEIGHHVQKVTGTEARVRQMMASRPSAKNALSVRLELQADCYAGVWGHSTSQRQILESGDVDEALTAAAAIGDDRLQRRSGGGVNPDSFTHGTSAQRATWFKRGMESGDPRSCDTFVGGV